MELEVVRWVDQARGAPGVATYVDGGRRIHRVDLVAGIDELTGHEYQENQNPPRLSADGKWMVRFEASRLELLDLGTGEALPIPGTDLVTLADRPFPPVLTRYRGRVVPNRMALWTKRAEPLVIDVTDSDPTEERRWRLVGPNAEHEFTIPAGHTVPVDLDGRHWLVCDSSNERLELLHADGTHARTLRAPRLHATD